MDRISLLKKEITLHNGTARAKGLAFIAIAPVCWYISYWLVWFLAFWPLQNFGVGSSRSIAHIIAWIGMGLLVIEFIRYGGPSLRIEDVGAWRATGTYGGYEMAKSVGQIYMIAQILFCAPRSVIHAVKAFRSVVKSDDMLIEKADAVIQVIIDNNQWVDIGKVGDDDCLDMLHTIKLIRFRDGVGKTEAGFSPKARELFDLDLPDPRKG